MQKTWTDGTVTIRPFRRDDVDALYEAVRESIDEVASWLSWCHAGYARSESEEWVKSRPKAWKRGKAYSFAVVDAATGRFLGGNGLNRISRRHQVANLGYWTRTSAAGQGVATRATRLVARFGFEELGLGRIEIVAAVGNAASQRVAQKVGAVREGLLRHRLLIHDERHDAVLFSLLPSDLA